MSLPIKDTDSIRVIGLKGLAAEARKSETFDDFKKAYLVDIKHGLYWHVTYDEDFKIDPNKGPRDMSSMSSGEESIGKLMVTSDLDSWAGQYSDVELTGEKPRQFAAIVDTTRLSNREFRSINRGFGNEFFIDDSSKASVVRTISLKDAKRLDRQYDKYKPANDEELKNFYDKHKRKEA